MTDQDNNKIIGLVGWTECGKDSLADVLEERHGWNRVAFADAMKEMLLAIDPCYKGSLELLEQRKRLLMFDTREKLQNLGKYMRDQDEDYWIYEAGLRYGALEGVDPDRLLAPELNTPLLFTDVRYLNEAIAVKDAGGTLVHIDRPGCGPINDHESESQTAECIAMADISISNTDTIEHLLAQFITCV